MVNRDGVLVALKRIVVEHLGADANKVNEMTDLVDDLDVDILDVVELSMALECDFGVDLNVDDFLSLERQQKCLLLKDVVDMVMGALERNPR